MRRVGGRDDGVQPGFRGRCLAPALARRCRDFHAGGHDGLHDGDGHRVHQRQAGEHDHGVDLGVQSHSLRPERDVHGDGESAVQRHADGHGEFLDGGVAMGWALVSGGKRCSRHPVWRQGRTRSRRFTVGTRTLSRARRWGCADGDAGEDDDGGDSIAEFADYGTDGDLHGLGGGIGGFGHVRQRRHGEFVDGGVAMGAAGVSGGQATYATFSLAAGTHTIAAALRWGHELWREHVGWDQRRRYSKGAGNADDRVGHAFGHHLRHGLERDAVECDGIGGRHVHLQSGAGSGAGGGDGYAVADVHADGHGGLHDGDGNSVHHCQQGGADDHVGPPAAITYGTALSATQLNATWSVAGTMVYSPAAGTVLGAGVSQTLHMTLIPADTTDYTTATAMVYINVNQAGTTTAVVSSGNPSVFGQSVTFTATVRVTSPRRHADGDGDVQGR